MRFVGTYDYDITTLNAEEITEFTDWSDVIEADTEEEAVKKFFNKTMWRLVALGGRVVKTTDKLIVDGNEVYSNFRVRGAL